MSDEIVRLEAELARAREARRREASAQRTAQRRERLIARNTVMVLRNDKGPFVRICATCSAEIVSVCVRGDGENGEIVRCANGHDCSRRFVVARRSCGRG